MRGFLWSLVVGVDYGWEIEDFEMNWVGRD